MTANVLNYVDQADATGDNVVNYTGTVNLSGTTAISGTKTISGTTAISGTVTDTSTLYSGKIVQTVVDTVTLAQSNAGKTLVAAVAGKTITVVGFDAKVSGNYADTTSIDLEDTNGTPVAIATLAVAALTDGAILDSKTSNVTMGAGFLGALTAGKGIAVTNTGSAATGGTSITFCVKYIVS